MKKQQTQKERVYDMIKWDIILGQIKPGDILNEIEMAKLYEFGKTPTREALLVLSHEKYLKPIPRVGYMVTEPAIQDIREIFHLRSLLEVEAIGQAVDRISEREIETLIKNNEEEREIYVSSSLDNIRGQALKLNQNFHVAIARAAGNARLAEIVQQLVQDLMRFLMMDPDLTDYTHHKFILGFIQQRDKAKAQEAMRNHIEETRSRVLNRF